VIMQKKHQVLFAIYTEQNRPFPDMNRINHISMHMENAQFKVVVDLLCDECLIGGAVIIGEEDWPIPRAVFLDNAKLTEAGMHYVTEVLRKAN
jgi:hypothetical protein